MKLKYFSLVAIFLTVKGASIPKNEKIPVEVVYLKNLEETPQEQQQQQQPVSGLRNLEAKPQLSLEDLAQSAKYIPVQDELGKLKIVTPDVPSYQGNQEYFKPLGFRPSQTNYPSEAYGSIENGDDFGIVIQAQEYVNNGLTKLGSSFQTHTSKLDELKAQYDLLFNGLRQQSTNPTNILQNIISNIQTVASNFVQGLTNGTSGESDEQRPSFGQTVLNTFNQITNNLTSFIQQQSTAAPITILGDSQVPVSVSPPANQNPFQIIQGVISNLNPFNQQQNANTQGDEGNTTAQSNPLQNIISNLNPFNQNNQSIVGQVSQAVSNLNPFNNQAPGLNLTTDNQQLGGLQSITSQVGQAINNLNPFNNQQQPSNTQGDTQQAGPIQNAVNQLGQVISNLNPFNQQNAVTAAAAAAVATTAKPADPVKVPLLETSNELPAPKPDPAQDAAKPGAAKLDATKPEVAKPEVAKPEVAKPEAVKLEAAKAEDVKAEYPKPDPVKPVASNDLKPTENVRIKKIVTPIEVSLPQNSLQNDIPKPSDEIVVKPVENAVKNQPDNA